MARLVGYGEDGLTFRAVTERLPELLSQLEDHSDPASVLVFYRPSFGRRSGRSGARGGAFGEFDAIIASDRAVYLVEAKWSRSGEVYGKQEISLRCEQRRRHRAFRWYLTRWRALQPTDWVTFRDAALSEFEATCDSLTIPHAKTHLAQNLQYVLEHLAQRGEAIVDVLLYADADASTCPPLPADSSFRLVSLAFPDLHTTGFFPMRVGPLAPATSP